MRNVGGKMKNREKYSDEILTAIISSSLCSFMHDIVIPELVDSRKIDEFCDKLDCADCSKMFAFWQDGVYVEPPTDWVNVPVDTLVRVRDDENGEWLLRYFNRFDEKPFGYRDGHNYAVFADGATSVTGSGYIEHWNYCELVEDTDEVSQ
ncbi:hypothetical protein [Mogibacterium kristiansenii]|nr:hypothetical protein [Mogibacterium kristiansenii]